MDLCPGIDRKAGLRSVDEYNEQNGFLRIQSKYSSKLEFLQTMKYTSIVYE